MPLSLTVGWTKSGDPVIHSTEPVPVRLVPLGGVYDGDDEEVGIEIAGFPISRTVISTRALDILLRSTVFEGEHIVCMTSAESPEGLDLILGVLLFDTIGSIAPDALNSPAIEPLNEDGKTLAICLVSGFIAHEERAAVDLIEELLDAMRMALAGQMPGSKFSLIDDLLSEV